MALDYVPAPPPTGWDTWEDWLRHFEVPEEEWADAASLIDPDGALPRVGFLQVPEGKPARNRLHIDLQVAVGGMSTSRFVGSASWPWWSGSSLRAAPWFRSTRSTGPGSRRDGLPGGNELCVV